MTPKDDWSQVLFALDLCNTQRKSGGNATLVLPRPLQHFGLCKQDFPGYQVARDNSFVVSTDKEMAEAPAHDDFGETEENAIGEKSQEAYKVVAGRRRRGTRSSSGSTWTESGLYGRRATNDPLDDHRCGVVCALPGSSFGGFAEQTHSFPAFPPGGITCAGVAPPITAT